MDENNYLKNIAGKFEFARGHWRIIVFLIFAAFLFYIATLSIDITTDMNISPSSEEVGKKFLTVKIKKDIIDKIDKFSSFKKEHLLKYLENPTGRDPFSSYEVNSSETFPAPSSTPIIPAD